MNDIELLNGRTAHLPVPLPPEIDIQDIAVSLAKRCRFNGYCSGFYSVADHSILVSQLLGRMPGFDHLRLPGLLHDAHEAYLSDIPTPVKELLGVDHIHLLENKVQTAIHSVLGVPEPTIDEARRVHLADRIVTRSEGQILMASNGQHWTGFEDIEPDLQTIYDLSVIHSREWPEALERFLNTYIDLADRPSPEGWMPND